MALHGGLDAKPRAIHDSPEHDLPVVSIIVACYNEKAHIESCLRSLLDNDYPSDKVELIVVDGMSTDGTREILKSFAATHSQVRVFDNPKRIFPAAMNVGICQSTGALIVPIGVH